jgi:DNA-binding transcriptional regulator YdaS (Cro superfamily)
MESPIDPVKLAAEKAGGIVKLSLSLGLSRGAASQWKKIPAERVVEVERLTGVPREILRPDLYRVQKNYTQGPGR